MKLWTGKNNSLGQQECVGIWVQKGMWNIFVYVQDKRTWNNSTHVLLQIYDRNSYSNKTHNFNKNGVNINGLEGSSSFATLLTLDWLRTTI